MNFFESQDRARRKTGQLIFLFVLATASLVVITNLFLVAVSGSLSSADSGGATGTDWQSHLFLSLAVLAVIAIASLYKIARLSGGGEVVAQSLGGRLLNSNTTDTDERRVLNVVEEMAIAAGLPVPPVYILDDDALNAFAAGFHTDDAVLGLTRGCVRYLNREELQGVIAHEFSHILHGDMKINIRLIGVLYGILVIGHIGYFLMRSASFRSRSSERDGLPIILIGVGLVVIGSIGTFFGNLIKASVSRQREYLADASAVQYTRNPDGIANALRKIGGFKFGSRLLSPNAAEASHLFIGQALKMSSLMATHPPLEDRISRLVPSWDGTFIDTTADFKERQSQAAREQHFGSAVSQLSDSGAAEPISFDAPAMAAGSNEALAVTTVLDSVGEIDQSHIDYASNLLDTMRGQLLTTVRSAQGARAAIYCLLQSDQSDVQKKQQHIIAELEDSDTQALMLKLQPLISELGIEYRIPIVDLCLPTLKRQFDDQDRDFRRCVLALMQADKEIDLFEWCLHRLFVRHLDGSKPKARRRRVRFDAIDELNNQINIILSALAGHAGSTDELREQAHAAGVASLALGGAELVYLPSPTLSQIDAALADLCGLAPLAKPRLIKAFAASVLADGQILAEEYELLRAVADSMDVPMPPRLHQQAVF